MPVFVGLAGRCGFGFAEERIRRLTSHGPNQIRGVAYAWGCMRVTTASANAGRDPNRRPNLWCRSVLSWSVVPPDRTSLYSIEYLHVKNYTTFHA